MEPHHEESINNLVIEMKTDDSILALILGGSLAHGFAGQDSDIDVAIVVSAGDMRKRREENQLVYVTRTPITYEGGYVDGKYVDLDFLEAVARRGSDPARFAFQGNRVLFSRIEGLEELFERIARFPVAEKDARRMRFAAQVMAWRWYFGEGARRNNHYLTTLALHKLVLFGGRLVLNENEMLYPYHKWLLRALEAAPRRPEGFMAVIAGLFESPSVDSVEAYIQSVLAFVGVDFEAAGVSWPDFFIKDSEQTWLDGAAPIDDI
jgi:predicted nucleotidyltransferase